METGEILQRLLINCTRDDDYVCQTERRGYH